MDTKVFIAVAAYNGISPRTMGTILQLVHSDTKVQLSVYPDCALITLARSELLGMFLQTDCTHILFLDTDISFDPKLLKNMLGTNKDVVANPYSSRHPPHHPLVNLVAPYNLTVGDNGSRLLEIHSTGLGCCLVSRKAIEETCKQSPELEYESNSGYKSWGLFIEAIRPAPPENKLKFMGEDIMFFFRLREAGFPAFSMVDAIISHANMDYTLSNQLDEISNAVK